MTHSRLHHLRALLIPFTTAVYLLVNPSAPWVALLFGVSAFFPPLPKDGERITSVTAPGGADAVLYALFALQCVNLVLAARLIAGRGFFSIQAAVALVLIAVSSSLCAAVGGHELIHRARPVPVALGRLLLASVLYEHFYAEHLRGHHVRFSTAEDPATARRGESFVAYLLRSPLAQLGSALELSPAQVAQGFAVQAVLLAAFALAFGPAGAAFFVVQALAVHVAFNAVQYFEHWGLDRSTADVHAWDAADRASLFGLVGLARHADHHARPGRPFDALELRPESPKLPRSYAGMIFMVIARNATFQRLMTAELERLGLARPEGLAASGVLAEVAE